MVFTRRIAKSIAEMSPIESKLMGAIQPVDFQVAE